MIGAITPAMIMDITTTAAGTDIIGGTGTAVSGFVNN
jgi:hypothetical protein